MATTTDRYSALQIALHWAIALLVIGNWMLSATMPAIADKAAAGEAVGTPLHVWFGLAILALMAVRIAVRLTQPVPGPPPGTTGLLATARHWGHISLYAMLVAVPVGGAATWFLGLETGTIHGIAGNVLMALAVGHIIMAFWHHGVKSDGTLTRMVAPRR